MRINEKKNIRFILFLVYPVLYRAGETLFTICTPRRNKIDREA
jgi:hypothetical protein